MGTEDAIVFTTGHQANVGTLGHDPRPGRHRRSSTPATTRRSSTAACSAGPSCAPSATTGSTSSSACSSAPPTTAAASSSSSTASSRWRATSPPLPEICDLCERFGARLMVDEAHGAGVLGARGAGATELLGVEDRVDLRMGTFSKSLASCGGFVAGPADVIEFLRIQSRAFLFTASAVPAAVGAALAALRDRAHRRGPRAAWPGPGQRALLQRRPRGARLRGRRAPGLPAATSSTPIVPVLGRRRLEGRPAVEGALRRRRLRQHRAAPGRPAGRRAAAHERHGDPRPRRRSTARSRPSRRSRPAFEAEHGPLPGPGEHG